MSKNLINKIENDNDDIFGTFVIGNESTEQQIEDLRAQGVVNIRVVTGCLGGEYIIGTVSNRKANI